MLHHFIVVRLSYLLKGGQNKQIKIKRPILKRKQIEDTYNIRSVVNNN